MRRFLVPLAFAAAVSSAARFSDASIVERVVAVVGDRPVFLSELRHRARPFLVRLFHQQLNSAQQAAAETEMYRELLSRMIDDRLEESAAEKARLAVTTDEVDRAVQNVAAQNRISVQDLILEAKTSGLNEQEYREEIRRQVLEGKLVQLRVRGRVRVTDQDARASYGEWVRKLGDDTPVDVRVLALRLPQSGDAAATEARTSLAAELAARARKGEDFCALVAQYSDDVTTKGTCGSRGPQSPGQLLPQITEAVRTMRAGDVADPIQYGKEAVIVVQLVNDPKVPTFDEVRDQMMERAFSEAMDRQRKMWLLELRRGVHVDVRL
jgi:peptidyl-prolyl cis-trans isomerase SurA